MLLGQWLRRSGMYPGYQVRFGRRDKLRFVMVGHGQRETLPAEELGTCEGHLVHHNFSKGISEWLTKHARYARDEARGEAEVRQRGRWADVWGDVAILTGLHGGVFVSLEECTKSNAFPVASLSLYATSNTMFRYGENPHPTRCRWSWCTAGWT